MSYFEIYFTNCIKESVPKLSFSSRDSTTILSGHLWRFTTSISLPLVWRFTTTWSFDAESMKQISIICTGLKCGEIFFYFQLVSPCPIPWRQDRAIMAINPVICSMWCLIGKRVHTDRRKFSPTTSLHRNAFEMRNFTKYFYLVSSESISHCGWILSFGG